MSYLISLVKQKIMKILVWTLDKELQFGTVFIRNDTRTKGHCRGLTNQRHSHGPGLVFKWSWAKFGFGSILGLSLVLV